LNPSWKNKTILKWALLALSLLLFGLSLIFNRFSTIHSSLEAEVSKAEKYLHHQQKDFDAFLADTVLVGKLMRQAESRNQFDASINKDYGIFLYEVKESGTLSLNFWNTHLVLPPAETFALPEMEAFMQLPNGHYLVLKKMLQLYEQTIMAYALIPVQTIFFQEKAYLPQKFVYAEEVDAQVVLSETETDYAVRSLQGNTLFYLNKINNSGLVRNDRLTIFLRFGGLLLLLLSVHLFAESISRRRLGRGIFFLAASLLLIRIAIYLFPGLLNLRQFDLFDPQIYGSNIVQRSLGDLLLNSIFFCWMVLFSWYKVHHQKDLTHGWQKWLKWTVALFSVGLLIYSSFILSSVIRSIVADSKVSFDVTNFFSLNFYTVVGFFVLATLSLSYYYFTQLLFRIIFPVLGRNKWVVYFAIAFSGLVFLSIRSGDPTVLFYLPVLAWLLLYTWLIDREGEILTRIRINIAGILFWIAVFSISIAAIMLTENRKAEWEKRKFYAEKLAVQTDPSSERLMSIALNYLDEDFLEGNFHRFVDSSSSLVIRDSILNQNYKLYMESFDTRLFVYDSTGQPLWNQDETSFDALNTIVLRQSQPTTYPDLFYYGTSFDQFAYITKRVARGEDGQVRGYLFILSNPRRFSTGEIYPELFRQYKENSPENSPIYFYAVYNQGKLTDNFSHRYPFPTEMEDNRVWKGNNEFERHNNGAYDELWYRAANQKVVIIARKRDTLIETIALFSYIFCSFIFLVFLVQVLSLILKAVSDWDEFKRFFHFNIRNQVHSTIIFISIFSFIIIGVATINFFKARYNRNNSDRLSRTMSIAVNEMEKRIGLIQSFDSSQEPYDSINSIDLGSLVEEVSEIHGVDVNVYDLYGNLQETSERDVYSKGIISKKMHPVAFYHLSRMKQVEHVQQESIADLPYLSVYAPVRDSEGRAYAYLSIPYFTSQPELNQEISNFIVTVINLNAFILLIAGLIALFITNRITRSFSVISDKMKDVNLGRVNEAIVWNRDDEIGDLVTEYNKMVAKLEDSAQALAKTEREGAWREMARQVAHEIKNPLTPMKLSIQYLQKSIDSNQPNVKELSGNVARTLVEQIDHLSKIAADFSQFANIGSTNAESFDLHEVLRSLYDLYQSNPNIEFVWRPVSREVRLFADKTQMNRLFTNLLANAVEACEGQYCRIELDERVLDGSIQIRVRDNGDGIPEEMQSRIFIPNFTTKSSGTGLGLAMCKGIVEQAQGKIWFETERGVGTSFYVELPLEENVE
jgi:signal transduction histidine kinase